MRMRGVTGAQPGIGTDGQRDQCAARRYNEGMQWFVDDQRNGDRPKQIAPRLPKSTCCADGNCHEPREIDALRDAVIAECQTRCGCTYFPTATQRRNG